MLPMKPMKRPKNQRGLKSKTKRKKEESPEPAEPAPKPFEYKYDPEKSFFDDLDLVDRSNMDFKARRKIDAQTFGEEASTYKVDDDAAEVATTEEGVHNNDTATKVF